MPISRDLARTRCLTVDISGRESHLPQQRARRAAWHDLLRDVRRRQVLDTTARRVLGASKSCGAFGAGGAGAWDPRRAAVPVGVAAPTPAVEVEAERVLRRRAIQAVRLRREGKAGRGESRGCCCCC